MNKKSLLIIAPAILAATALVGCNNNKPNPGRDPDWITKENWYELTNNAVEEDIGKTVTVKVNGQDHLVRLIGIDHDVDEKDFTIHTTWEFANLISDAEGYSLAYQWNDTNDDAKANLDYVNSSMRKILNGTGEFATSVYCATKTSLTPIEPSDRTWDPNYKDVTVLSMLPSALRNVLKTVKKTTRTTTEYVKTEFTDKLFLLSCREIGFFGEKVDGEVYPYYYTEDKTEGRIRRLKAQVKGNEGALTDPVNITSGAPAKYTQTIFNYAGGYNVVAEIGPKEYNYGLYWLRSPDSNKPGFAHECSNSDSTVAISGWANCYTCAVAPAFCI